MLYQPQSCDNVTQKGTFSDMHGAGNSNHEIFLAIGRL